jgi:hypothetical protein
MWKANDDEQESGQFRKNEAPLYKVPEAGFKMDFMMYISRWP